MARPRQDPERRRQQLMDAAERLFEDQGYEETAVTDIVASLGVAQGTFYYYFGSKDAILDAIIARILDRSVRQLEAMVADEAMSAPEKVLRFYALDIETRKRHRVLDLLHVERNALLHHRLRREKFPRTVPLLQTIVEQGVRDGVFRVDDAMVAAAGLLLVEDMVELMDATPETFGIHPDVIQPLQMQMERILGAEPGTLVGYSDLWEGLHEVP